MHPKPRKPPNRPQQQPAVHARRAAQGVQDAADAASQRSGTHREQHKLGRALARDASRGVGGRVQGCRAAGPHDKHAGGMWHVGPPLAAAGVPLQGPGPGTSRPPASAAPIVASSSRARMVPIGGAVRVLRVVPRTRRPASRLQGRWPAGDRGAQQADQGNWRNAQQRRTASGRPRGALHTHGCSQRLGRNARGNWVGRGRCAAIAIGRNERRLPSPPG